MLLHIFIALKLLLLFCWAAIWVTMTTTHAKKNTLHGLWCHPKVLSHQQASSLSCEQIMIIIRPREISCLCWRIPRITTDSQINSSIFLKRKWCDGKCFQTGWHYSRAGQSQCDIQADAEETKRLNNPKVVIKPNQATGVWTDRRKTSVHTEFQAF